MYNILNNILISCDKFPFASSASRKAGYFGEDMFLA